MGVPLPFILMLYIITWLTDFSAFLLLFAVGRQLAEDGAGALLMGSLGALFSLASAASNFLAGPVSDRFGRRRVAAAGILFLVGCVALVFLAKPGHAIFYIAYTASGFAFGAIYPPIIAWLGHGRRGRSASRAYLFFCLAWNAGVLSGQMAGGYLYQQGGIGWPLAAALGLLAVEFALMVTVRDPTRGRIADPPDATDDGVAERSAAFARLAWVANFGSAFSISIVIFLLPRLLVSLDIGAEQHGMLLSVGRVVAIGMYCLMHATNFWHHRFDVALVAQAAGALGMIGTATATTATGLALALCSLSILLGYNYFASLYYSTTGSADHKKGRAGGIHEATLALGFAGGSMLGGLADRYMGVRTPYMLAAGVIVVLMVPQVAMYGRSLSRR